MRPTEGKAQPCTGAACAAPLYLIHTTKCSNSSLSRVSGRFSFVSDDPIGVPLAAVSAAFKRHDLVTLQTLFERGRDAKSNT